MPRIIEVLAGLLAASALLIACAVPRLVSGDKAAMCSHGALRIEVVSSPTGAPLPDAIVRIEARHPEGGPATRAQQVDRERVRAHALTDRDGRVHLTPDPGIDLWVRVMGQRGACFDEVREVAALQAGEAQTIRFEIPAREMGQVWGRVVSARTGMPVEAVRVAWLDDTPGTALFDRLDRPLRRGAVAATLTGTDGRFELPVPVTTELRLAFEANGFRPMLAELTSPSRATQAARATEGELVIALERCEQRAILVVDAQSRALSDVDVIVQPFWSMSSSFRLPGDPAATDLDDVAIARTGPDGVCWFPEPHVGGHFHIDAVSADGSWLGAHRFVGSDRAAWPDPRVPLVWRLAERQPIEGRARFEDGKPAADVVLGLGERQPTTTRALYQARTFVALTRTAPDGTFRFESVRPPRPGYAWMIEPRPGTLDRLQVRRDAIAPTRALVQYDIDGRAQPLDVDLLAARYVTGRVSDSAGRPASPGWLGVRSIDANVEDSTTCDPDGSFLLGPLAPGRYELRARLDDRGESLAPCEVRIDALGTAVTLQPDERYELVLE